MAIHFTIPLGFMLALSLCMVWVVISDVSRYIISNNLNLTLLILYGVAIFLLPVEPLWALLGVGIVLAVGLCIFALGLMGGGDVKLLAVLTLWVGWGTQILALIFLTGVVGGLLVVLVLFLRAVLPPLFFKIRPTKPIPRILTRKEPIPYGLAIAFAFLLLMWAGGIPALQY